MYLNDFEYPRQREHRILQCNDESYLKICVLFSIVFIGFCNWLQCKDIFVCQIIVSILWKTVTIWISKCKHEKIIAHSWHLKLTSKAWGVIHELLTPFNSRQFNEWDTIATIAIQSNYNWMGIELVGGKSLIFIFFGKIPLLQPLP